MTVGDRDPERQTEEPRGEAEEKRDRDERGRPGEPHRLQPLDPDRALKPDPDRDRACDEAAEHAEQERERQPLVDAPEQSRDRVVLHRIRNRGVVAVERSGVEECDRDEPAEADIAAPRATHRHLGESSFPFGKTNATAIGHA